MDEFNELMAKLDALPSCDACEEFQETDFGTFGEFKIPERYRTKEENGIFASFAAVVMAYTQLIATWVKKKIQTTILVLKEYRRCQLIIMSDRVAHRACTWMYDLTDNEQHRWCCKIKNLLKLLGFRNLECNHDTLRSSLCFTGECVCMKYMVEYTSTPPYL